MFSATKQGEVTCERVSSIKWAIHICQQYKHIGRGEYLARGTKESIFHLICVEQVVTLFEADTHDMSTHTLLCVCACVRSWAITLILHVCQAFSVFEKHSSRWYL